MDFSKQIKKYRLEAKLSQDELAEKVFVTRQTISNWENDKNYPDIHSLLLLSSVFDISLDTLVKGDLDEMKEQIKMEDIKKLNQDSIVYSALLLVMIVSAVPLFLYLDFIGVAIYAVMFGITMYYAWRIEKQKKVHDIQTYKEITAFMEGNHLDEIQKYRESGKRPYQKVALAICAGLITLAVCAAMMYLLS